MYTYIYIYMYFRAGLKSAEAQALIKRCPAQQAASLPDGRPATGRRSAPFVYIITYIYIYIERERDR